MGIIKIENFECHVQVWHKLYPEYPIRSRAEAYYQLKKPWGVQSWPEHNFDTTGPAYRSIKMVLGIDTDNKFQSKIYKIEHKGT